MPSVERPNGSMNESPVPFPEGAFCETTKRIVVISPFPALLQGLVSELMARCYDVLTFHNAKEPILPLLQNDLIVVDRTWGTEEDGTIAEAATSERLYLIGERTPSPVPAGHTLAWPAALETAIARIESLAGQSNPPAPAETASDRLRFKDVEMDLKRMTVLRRGAKIDLTKTEFDLLRVLLSSDGGVLTRQAIMEAIWGDGYFGGSNSVDVHIKSLRQKLGDDPKSPVYIATVRGVGYRIVE
ncbi:winged helix-turn-helix transcriptional regulator [Paenibacillus glycinis]|uniref:Transcriptional regulator n=1 Tax=Paenibacillus glycinis TaxID=2697035 RepID=A0ABW9XI80_9BACL|nr:response regulator transcription factor [Paenibacillus glycinis]NBD22320.1 transcriptional regulator [Paenibacillus glycinis]